MCGVVVEFCLDDVGRKQCFFWVMGRFEEGNGVTVITGIKADKSKTRRDRGFARMDADQRRKTD
jgi:hypothetical protein